MVYLLKNTSGSLFVSVIYVLL